MRGWLYHRWTPLYLLLLSLGAFLLFLYGFFPLEYQSGRHASRDSLPNHIRDVSVDGQTLYDTEPTTVVLMVIDALRHDFVTEELMPFTALLLRNRSACEYVALAEPPTVTMPRIKAMMTGRVSTFADVALNFGAPAVAGDSVLRAGAKIGRRFALYGDDTWLRLFPDVWAEHDGTSSFYVSDYTEVDDNVTRHLKSALYRYAGPDFSRQPRFDLVVLHYLGLDHIGHLEGAHSSKIAPKLREMDDVVQTIFDAIQNWKREGVLIVCGDHGMRDAGGHGGASPAELRVPLVLMRSADFQCPHVGRPTVAQTDVAPSLAYLLRAPLPADSTGRVLPSLLPGDPRRHLYVLHYNALENAAALATKIGQERLQERECYKQFRRAEEQFAEYLTKGRAGAARLAREYYEEALTEMASYLAESTVKFDMFAITLGIVMLLLMLIGLFTVTAHAVGRSAAPRAPHSRRAGAALAFLLLLALLAGAFTLACAVTETASDLCRLDATWTPLSLAALAALAYVYFVIKAGAERSVDASALRGRNVIDRVLIAGTALHALTYAGTSFIEEEHQTWYFGWSTLALCVLARAAAAVAAHAAAPSELREKPRLRAAAATLGTRMLPCWLLLMALHRFLRTLNQTGDRWLFLPDTADWLNEPDNSLYLHLYMVAGMAATLLICLWNLRFTNNVFQMNTALTIVAVGCVALYRMATHALPSPHPAVASWDPVHVVNVFWGLLAAQFVSEGLTFLGAYRRWWRDVCGHGGGRGASGGRGSAFVHRRRKEKIEDYESYVQEAAEEDAASADGVKLALARSLSHATLNALLLTTSLLVRPHNAALPPAAWATCALAAECVRHAPLPPVAGARAADDALTQPLVHHWIGALFFFYQGNSNSLASVELSAGYVGLREYSPLPVALRMALHAYAGPALAAMSLFCTLAARHDTWDEYRRAVRASACALALVRVYSLAVYACVAAAFRHHLFVWSVFSPKLLYELAACVVTVAALLSVAAVAGASSATHAVARMLAGRAQ